MKRIGRHLLLFFSSFYLKNDFFSVEGQYELEWKLRKNRWLRALILWLALTVGKKQTYYHILKIDREQKLLNSFSDNKSVRRGPFAGLTYPSLESYGSVLAAKLLGSYELELDDAVEETLRKPYTHVLDIGCAEGYYAVGYAKKLPEASIHAFDINPEALARCRKMATVNQVADRLTYHRACTPEFLESFDFSGLCLIISDCEGYEQDLFTPHVVEQLTKCDLIIEVHEDLRPGVTAALTSVFQKSHQVRLIPGIGRNPAKYPELEPFSVTEKQLILYELRNKFEDYRQEQYAGQWLYVTTRADKPL